MLNAYTRITSYNVCYTKLLRWLDTDYFTPGHPGELQSIKKALLEWGDTYLALADFDAYDAAHQRLDKLYRDKAVWAKMAIINAASVGKFNSDRSIEDYVRQIWHLEKFVI